MDHPANAERADSDESTLPQRIDPPKYKRVSRQTEGLILKLAEAGKSQVEIAGITGVSQPTVSRTLAEFADTRHVAKALLNSAATRLAERVIKQANVEESLEVLDRLDVAPKKQRDSGGNNQVNIVIGMPGQPAGNDPFASLIALSPSVDGQLAE